MSTPALTPALSNLSGVTMIGLLGDHWIKTVVVPSACAKNGRLNLFASTSWNPLAILCYKFLTAWTTQVPTSYHQFMTMPLRWIAAVCAGPMAPHVRL